MPSRHTKTRRAPAHPAEKAGSKTLKSDPSADLTLFWQTWEQCREACLLRYCLKWMDGNLEDAEDALSSASLKALQHYREHAQTIGNLKSWLIRLVYHHCMDLHRVHKRYHRAVASAANLSWSWTDGGSSTTRSPEHLVLLHELQGHVHTALARIPVQLHRPVYLRYWDNLAHNDIAVHLHLSSCNTRKRLQKARAQLRSLLTLYYAEKTVTTQS